MRNSNYTLTFDGCGTTMVKARTTLDAILSGQTIERNGRKNVRIASENGCLYTLGQFEALFSGVANHDGY